MKYIGWNDMNMHKTSFYNFKQLLHTNKALSENSSKYPLGYISGKPVVSCCSR